jgi:hypothetical protein
MTVLQIASEGVDTQNQPPAVSETSAPQEINTLHALNQSFAGAMDALGKEPDPDLKLALQQTIEGIDQARLSSLDDVREGGRQAVLDSLGWVEDGHLVLGNYIDRTTHPQEEGDDSRRQPYIQHIVNDAERTFTVTEAADKWLEDGQALPREARTDIEDIVTRNFDQAILQRAKTLEAIVADHYETAEDRQAHIEAALADLHGVLEENPAYDFEGLANLGALDSLAERGLVPKLAQPYQKLSSYIVTDQRVEQALAAAESPQQRHYSGKFAAKARRVSQRADYHAKVQSRPSRGDRSQDDATEGVTSGRQSSKVRDIKAQWSEQNESAPASRHEHSRSHRLFRSASNAHRSSRLRQGLRHAKETITRQPRSRPANFEIIASKRYQAKSDRQDPSQPRQPHFPDLRVPGHVVRDPKETERILHRRFTPEGSARRQHKQGAHHRRPRADA